MMRSLYSGVSGLKTHQIKMDVIGNNIANVNTMAYKSQSMVFSELMYQTTQAASGANATTGRAGTNAKQIGLGVQAGAITASVATAGASQSTGNPFDIKITGSSFFVVNDGSKNFFTRDGSFYVDGQGNLAMSSNGYNVMGWQADDATGTVKKDTVSALRIMGAENLTYPPQATTDAYVSGIVDKNDPSVSSEAGKIISVSFFDKLGYAYTAKLSMKATGEEGLYSLELSEVLDSNGNKVEDSDKISLGEFTTVSDSKALSLRDGYKWNGSAIQYTQKDGTTASLDLTSTATMTAEDKKTLANAFGYSSYEEFAKLNINNDAGVAETINTLMANNALGGKINAEGVLNVDGRSFIGGKIQYDTATGTIKTVNGSAENLTMELNFGGDPKSAFQNITIDFSTSSNYNNNGTSTVSATSGDLTGLGAGRRLGNMSGISIQNDGMIYATYDNGMTKLLGQIAVANFANASGLQKEGDNLYSATLNSGEFDGIGSDITADGGYMSTGVLEMSNVDLSAEFTEMITTQRGFQANSRIITVSDTLLEELVNLKR